jgi:tRNA(Ile)-lysidine synthetase-like protein
MGHEHDQRALTTVPRRVRDWLLAREPVRRPSICGCRIVVAASGGADSSALVLALAEALHSLGSEPSSSLVVAHFNHRLRSDRDHLTDLEVVRGLAARVGASLIISEAATDEIRDGAASDGGLESAARRLRYEFLASAATAAGALTICTGHTRDDQAETVLMRLLSGIEGVLLEGIPESRQLNARLVIERPLLDTSRREIECYLEQNGVQWSNDRTNFATRYRRNRVRHEILPQIETVWPAVRDDLVALGRAMARYRVSVRDQAAAVGAVYEESWASVPREEFFRLSVDARLEFLYGVLRRLNRLDRGNRPGHAFFAPVLGSDPGGDRRLIEARGTRIEARGDCLIVRSVLSAPVNSGIFRGIG